MSIVVDTNILFAVILNTQQKKYIIQRTQNMDLAAPDILPAEFVNALSSKTKKGLLTKDMAIDCYHTFQTIPVRLVSINMEKALAIAMTHNIYAYDAYFLETAKRLGLPLMTLDKKMQEVARKQSIYLEEVEFTY